jgi:hypothetical protein
MKTIDCARTPDQTSAENPAQTVQSMVATRLSRLEFVFLHTSHAGAPAFRRFLERNFEATLRTEYNSQPPQHRFEAGEIRWQVDWISRIVPHTGRAFAVNFLMTRDDIGQTERPVRFATLLRHPLTRLAGEYLLFQEDVSARGAPDNETRHLSQNIVAFADAHWRNNYLVRFFSRRDLCDPIDADAERSAQAALNDIDVIGLHENHTSFVERLCTLDPFSSSKIRNALMNEMTPAYEGPGEKYVRAMDAGTRAELERRNLGDMALYEWASSEGATR